MELLETGIVLQRQANNVTRPGPEGDTELNMEDGKEATIGHLLG